MEQVLFPFDPAFPQYALARQQMSGACGLMTMILKADSAQQIETFCEKLKHILIAVSWGGHESLVIPLCAGVGKKDFNASNPEHRMVRLYVGLEDAAYIIADLEQAFEAIIVK